MDTHDNPESSNQTLRQRTSLWSKIGGGPLMFAVVFHVILFVIGGIWIFQITKEPEKKIDFLPPGGGGSRGADHQIQQKRQAQVIPTSNTKRVFAEGAKASYTIPDQDDKFGKISALTSLSSGSTSAGLGGSGTGGGAGLGKGLGVGGGMGTGNGISKLFDFIPETMRKRCSKQDRLLRLTENGGTANCEDAVVKSLRWFRANQNPDGSWGKSYKTAMTGFALLCYFGHCETPSSEEFGESCMKGILYLVNVGIKNDGKLSNNLSGQPWVYEHAIATYALGEAATFCKELKIEVPSLMEITESRSINH